MAKIITNIVVAIFFISQLFTSVNTQALVISEGKRNKVQTQGGIGATPIDVPLADISPDFLKPLRADLPADKTKDRLNMVFVYSTEIPDEEIINYTNFISTTIDKTQVPSSTSDRGFLQTEPIRSNRNKINLWNYTQKIDPGKFFDYTGQVASHYNLLEMSYVVPIFVRPEKLLPNPLDQYEGRSNASLPKLQYATGYTIQSYYPGKINDLFMLGKSDSTFSKDMKSILTHELGHAMFNLADEYSERNNAEPLIAYPNCALDTATARAWWGDLEGQTDPYIREVKETSFPRSDFAGSRLNYPGGPTYDEYIQDDLNFYKIGYYGGGCFADFGVDKGQTKPLPFSLMSDPYNIPFFGLVNSREINKVFALFSGTSQIIPKSLPLGVPVTNFQYFEFDRFENADCKVILVSENTKKIHCDFVTKPGKKLSKSPQFEIRVEENTDYDSNLEPPVFSSSNCNIEDNTVKCLDMDVSSANFDKKIKLVWKFSGQTTTTNKLTTTIENSNNLDIKLKDFNVIDKVKPTVKITDPYACGGSITGNVADNLGVGNIKSTTVKLTKSGDNTPKYTFSPIIDTLGNYSIDVQQADRNNTSTFVEAGEYTVSYFATDKSDNISNTGTYIANIKSKDACVVKQVIDTKPVVTTKPVLIRTGGSDNVLKIIITLVVSMIFFITSAYDKSDKQGKKLDKS